MLQGITASAQQLASILASMKGSACNVDLLLLRAGIDYVGEPVNLQTVDEAPSYSRYLSLQPAKPCTAAFSLRMQRHCTSV